MTTITVIFTCFNRKEKTLQCIRSLSEGNKQLSFSYVIVDDNSTDGTREALEALKQEGTDLTLLSGTGSLFWAGGMRRGIAYARSIRRQIIICWSMMMWISDRRSLQRWSERYRQERSLTGMTVFW